MTSPLAQFANASILWTSGGTRLGGADGYSRTAGQSYLIRAFIKSYEAQKVIADRLGLPGIGGEGQLFEGYVVSYAEVTPQEVGSFESLDLSTLTFDETAQRPPNLATGAKAKLYIEGRGKVDATFVEVTNAYGHQGIGGIVRDILGDRIVLDGGQV